MTNDDRIMSRPPQAFLGGIFIPILAISLIFGNSLVGFMAILIGLLVAALALFPGTQPRLEGLLAQKGGRQGMAMLIPILAVAGIFGNALLMVMVLVMAFFALLVATLRIRTGTTSYIAAEPGQDVRPTPAEVHALPVQASGEPVDEIDIRALCRGLPASVSGEVISTVDHLELVAVQAGNTGDTRRAYSARQGLRDYLPNTVNAWKALPDSERQPDELARALQQIRDIAGDDEQNADSSRKAWEIQQRFLNSKAEKKS